MLGLGVDPDRHAAALALLGREVEHLVEGGDLEAPVVPRVGRTHLRQTLLGAQRLELGEREVLGEPAGERGAVNALGGLPGGELGVVGDVGGAGDVVLVAADEVAVPGGDEVLLDDVGAEVEGVPVGAEGVLGAVAAGAAVGDDGGDGERAVAAAPAVASGPVAAGVVGPGLAGVGGARGEGRRGPQYGRGSGRSENGPPCRGPTLALGHEGSSCVMSRTCQRVAPTLCTEALRTADLRRTWRKHTSTLRIHSVNPMCVRR